MLKKVISICLTIVMVFSLVCIGSLVLPDQKVFASYTPKLPKMPATTSVVVLDLTKDKSEHSWNTDEALLAIVTIQGIVNRTSAQKIYLVNAPQKWCGIWNPPATDQFALDDGLVPVSKTYPTLDNNKRFPVLSYLLANYSSYITGKIYYPDLSKTVNDGAVMAAITACAQTNSIPVSSTIDSYMIGEGKDFTVKEDCRNFADDVAAFTWAKTNYFNANTTRAFIAKHGFKYWGGGPGLTPMAFDYYVACKAFIYSLDANVMAEKNAVPNLLNTGCYPAGTPVLGEMNGEGIEISTIQGNGYYFTFCDGANFSVHSSFPSDPAAITAPTAPTASAIDNNGAYIAFYITDGDNLSIAEYNHHDYWRNSSYKGQVPLGWSLPSFLLDIYPKKLEWFSNNNYNNKYELVCNFNDGTAPKTTAGADAFKSTYKSYMDNSNGLFRSMNYFNENTSADTLITYIHPYFCIRGYQGRQDCQDVINWKTLDNNTITQVNMAGATQNNAYASNVALAARSAVSKVASGTPAFILVCAGDGGHSKDPATIVKGAVDNLNGNPQGRNYYFLRPQDLAATWKVWKGYSAATSTP